MNDDIEKILEEFSKNPGVADDVLTKLESKLGKELPHDYRSFLLQINGGEGFIGEEYFILWKAEELLQFNKEYEVHLYAPGLFMFGSNGSGEGFAFNESSKIVQVPFIGLSPEDAILVVDNFYHLLEGCTHRMRDYSDIRKGDIDRFRGMEIYEITPIILGGSATDPKNKAILNRQQHFELVRYWNKILANLRE